MTAIQTTVTLGDGMSAGAIRSGQTKDTHNNKYLAIVETGREIGEVLRRAYT